MSSYICCYNENRELEHFKVPESIFVYIRQLECEIKYNRGGIQKVYPGRFKPLDKLAQETSTRSPNAL